MLHSAGVLRQRASDKTATQTPCRCVSLQTLYLLWRISSFLCAY